MKNLKKIFFGLVAIAFLFSFVFFTNYTNKVYALSETTPVIVSVDEILVDQETNMGGAPTAMIDQEYLAKVIATGENLTFSAGTNGYMELPEGLTINSSTGVISGTCTDNIGRYNVYIEVSNSVGNAHAVIGITVGDALNVPVISTESGKLGTIYKDSISVLNAMVQNDATYSIYNFKWSLKSGSLPEGMNLVYTSSSTLNISGTPTQTGTFTFELEAKNDCGSDVKTFSIEVIEGSVAPNIVEIGDSLGYGVIGLAYEYQLEASGTNSNEDPMVWSTSSSDFSQESYSLGNGLTLSKNGLVTGTIQDNSQINFTAYVKNSKGTDSASFFIVIYDNGEVYSATITPEVTVVTKGSSKEFTISLEGYGNVEQVAYWSFYMWDDDLDGVFPQPTDSELSVNSSTPSKTVTLSVGENEERQQIRVVAYSKPGNNGIKTWATITIIEEKLTNQARSVAFFETASNGTPVDSINNIKPYLVNGVSSSTGTLGENGCTAYIDCETGILYLNNYNGGPIACLDEYYNQLQVVLQGTNIITNSTDSTADRYGIFSKNGLIDITSSSDGTLTINVTNTDENRNNCVYGIAAGISSGQVTGKIKFSGNANVIINVENYSIFELTGAETIGIFAYDGISFVDSSNVMVNLKSKALGMTGGLIAIYSSHDEFGILFDTTGDITLDNSVPELSTYSQLIRCVKVEMINVGTLKSIYRVDGRGYGYENDFATPPSVDSKLVNSKYILDGIVTSTYKNINTESFDIIYNSNGGTGYMSESPKPYNVNYRLLNNQYTAPSGKQFKCWNVNGEEKEADILIEITGDMLIKAVWEDASATALQNVQLNNGVLTWDAFPGAAEYGYSFGPGGGYLDETSLDLEHQAKSFHLETGEYNYTIYAVDEYRTKISDELTGTYNYTNNQTPLATPTNLEWNHTVASWDEVEGAEYYVLLIYEYNNPNYNLITYQGQFVYGLSFDMGKRFEVNKTYCFDVKALAAYDDLDHLDSEYARSEHHTFESVVQTLTNVTIENGQLSFDTVEGASKYEISIATGGGNYESLPIDLYTLCSLNNVENGTYDITIKVYNEHNEPLAPKYTYENWEYDSSLAPKPLTGTVQITGTLKVGETLTATLNDTNNTGTLTYTWYRSDPLEGWISVQTGTSNTFTITEPCANKRISVVVTSDKEISQVESENTGVIAEADKAEILNGTVTITGTLKYGETITANVTNSNNSGTLSYQWKRNGVDILGATAQTYTITADDIGKILRVVVTSTVETGEIPSEATAIISKADNLVAPTGLTTTDCTTNENNDGTIVGVTTLMEYKLSTSNNWIDVTQTTITGLANGVYKVRFKETSTHNVSSETTVTINEYVEIDDGLIRNIEITGMPEVVLGNNVPCDKNILSIPNDAKYEIQGIGWYDFIADEWVSVGDVFISGHSYQFSVNLVAKNEYAFANGNEITATINGNSAEVYKNGNIIMVKYLVGNPIQYTITFDAGDGTGSMDSVVVGGNYTLPECTFVAPEGMIFDKWNITDIGDKNANDVIMITQNITITAVWKEKPVIYTITFNAGGGNGSMNEVEIESGNLYSLPNCLFTPANEYLMFKEWNVSDVGTRSVGYNLTVYNNHTITAVWVHKCKLTPVEEVGANCATETNGKEAHYVCNGCEKKYSDENGEHLIQNFENWGVIQFEHEFTGDLVIHNASTHGYKCVNDNCLAVGGYEQHTFETWESNAEEHWKVCECGQKDNLNYHNNPEKFTGKSSNCEELGWNDYYQCECGKLFSDENCEHIIEDLDAWKLGDGKIDYAHNHTSEWKTDETKHWNECSCGESKTNENNHTDGDNNGKCDICDYQITTSNPPAKPENKGLGAGGIVAIVIVSVIVLGTGSFALVWFVIKKKTWADFISIFKKK